MGFETPQGWTVKSSSPATRTASTTTRTQGSFAFALENPSDQTTMTSQPVRSDVSTLTGIGDSGSIFEADVMPPDASGSLKLSVSSPSRGLKSEPIGEVDLAKLRAGIYNTLKFPIPDNVRTALSANFADLSFEFVLNLPAPGSSRQFLFDNLHVHSLTLTPAKTGDRPPAGFGGSVNLAAIGEAPVAQSFGIAPVQVPDSFRLTEGVAGTTKVNLALGYDGGENYICTYDPDSSDKAASPMC